MLREHRSKSSTANHNQIEVASLDLSAAIRPYCGPIDTAQGLVKTVADETPDHVPGEVGGLRILSRGHPLTPVNPKRWIQHSLAHCYAREIASDWPHDPLNVFRRIVK